MPRLAMEGKAKTISRPRPGDKTGLVAKLADQQEAHTTRRSLAGHLLADTERRGGSGVATYALVEHFHHQAFSFNPAEDLHSQAWIKRVTVLHRIDTGLAEHRLEILNAFGGNTKTAGKRSDRITSDHFVAKLAG